jgi:hypothetical protein
VRRASRLVDDVREVGAAAAGRQTGRTLDVEFLCQRDRSRMDPEDLHASDEIGIPEGDLPIEAAGAQERRIENLWTVGGRHNDHRPRRVGFEAVDLGQQLIERLLALVVGHHHANGPCPALTDRIDLIDEDNCRGGPARLLEIDRANDGPILNTAFWL